MNWTDPLIGNGTCTHYKHYAQVGVRVRVCVCDGVRAGEVTIAFTRHTHTHTHTQTIQQAVAVLTFASCERLLVIQSFYLWQTQKLCSPVLWRISIHS